LSVSTIFQASSESSIGFTVPESEAARGVQAVRAAFKDELASGVIDNVTARPGIAVVAVVGEGMAGAPGIAARVFSALAARSINVVAIAQGSSERNISFAVNAGDAPEAVRAVHDAFQLSKIGGGRPLAAPRTDVVLLGFGNVGRALTLSMTPLASSSLNAARTAWTPRAASLSGTVKPMELSDDAWKIVDTDNRSASTAVNVRAAMPCTPTIPLPATVTMA